MNIRPSIFTMTIIAALGAAVPVVWSQTGLEIEGAVPVDAAGTACLESHTVCLNQGWSDVQRSWWYTVSQGSRLLPLSWALALKTPAGDGAMFGPHNTARLGYLPNPRSEDNPHGLPIGFVVDHDPSRGADLMCDTFPETCQSRTMRAPWLGLNCSACHTAEIELDGERRLRLDGAPALADFTGLVHGVEDALHATLDDPARFASFAQEIVGDAADAAALDSLRAQIGEQVAWMGRLRAVNGDALPAGPARLDAQGHILTKVTMINGGDNDARTDDADRFRADAPSSYPFIWNTHQQKKLQWNGIVSNATPVNLLGRETDLGALIRNTSEVIGVFAHIEADRGWASLGYDSSVRVRSMVGLERLLSQLQSPLWPEDLLGAIDVDLARRGADLFDAQCKSCHSPLAADDLTTPAGEIVVPLARAGTDVFLACNTFLRRAEAGNMKGQSRFFPIQREEILANDLARAMLVNAAGGAIYGKLHELIPALIDDIEPQGDDTVMISMTTAGEYLPGVTDPVKKARAEACLTRTDPILGYKARPLNGIWATAPYLHNGSVPTLYDLLLPSRHANTVMTLPDFMAGTAKQDPYDGPWRPDRFAVGSRAFDAAKVGYVSDPASGPWTFDVTDENGIAIPGNSNAGHDYGNADLDEADRRALVEYLKSL